MQLGKIEKIGDLRGIWPHEALDFTPWLADEENLALLCDAVGVDMTVDEMESSVGSFNVDILGTETDTGRKIVIENQLEDTNHDHLGKTITYAAGKNANIIIWMRRTVTSSVERIHGAFSIAFVWGRDFILSNCPYIGGRKILCL